MINSVKKDNNMYLIIGASGFIGSHLYRYCQRNKIDVMGTFCTHQFDLCTDDLEIVCQSKLGTKIPDALIICGANASIDSCKRNEEESNEINVEGTKRILKQAGRLGIKVIFFSSEAVFDGGRGLYAEDDEPTPITLYGKQKLQIEQFMHNRLEDYLVFRISRATGCCFGKKDIFNEFYKKIINGEEIVCLKNQSFCITDVDDIAKVAVKAIEQGMNGIYHLSSANYVSRYDLAVLYAEKVFGGYDRISEKDYDEMSFLDKRNIYGGLNGNKLENLLGVSYRSTEEILDKYLVSFLRLKDIQYKT